MFYKVEKGSELFDSLQELLGRMKKAREEAKAFVDKIPKSIDTYIPGKGFAGGVMCVGFSNKEDVPKDWVVKHEESGNIYATPRDRRNSVKEVRQEMENLPVIQNSEFNNLLNYDPMLTIDKTNSIWWKPGYAFKDDMVLITVSEEQVNAGYEPVEGMTEITKSEFDKLYKEDEPEKEAV